MKTRHSILVVLLLAVVSIVGFSAYKLYSALYDHIMEKSEAVRIRVEEVSGTHPLQLKITTDISNGFEIVRSVSVKTHGAEMTIFYHVALAGLGKPVLYWGLPYTVTIPDSVKELRFGRRKEAIWERRNTGE